MPRFPGRARWRWLLVPVVAAVALVGFALPGLAADPDTVRPTPPGVPTATFPASGAITLTWTPSTDDVGVTGYRVTRWYIDFGILFTTPTNSITLNDQTPSDTYLYSVQAVDAAGNVSNSVSLRVTFPPGDSTPPTTPSTPIATAVTDTTINLSWSPGRDNIRMEEHQIFRIQGTTQTLMAHVTFFFFPNAWQLTGLTPGTTYVLAVKARDAAGNESPLSPTTTVTTTTGTDTQPPTTPTNLAATDLTTSSLRLTWTPSTDNVGVTSYQVTQIYTDIVTFSTTTTNSITISGLSASRTYRFSVSARDAAGNVSPTTATLKVTLPPGDSQPPTAPGTPVASNLTDTAVTLTWARSTDNVIVEIYDIMLITPTGPVLYTSTFSYPGPPNSITLSGLTTGTTYRFAVRARDAVGNISPLSGEVVVTPGGTTTTPPPSGCTATYRITSQWGGGFNGEVVITNTSTATLNGWTVRWTYSNGQVISNLWNGVKTQTGGAVTVRNASYNGTLAPGATTTFGFQASWSGSNPVPAPVTCSSP